MAKSPFGPYDYPEHEIVYIHPKRIRRDNPLSHLINPDSPPRIPNNTRFAAPPLAARIPFSSGPFPCSGPCEFPSPRAAPWGGSGLSPEGPREAEEIASRPEVLEGTAGHLQKGSLNLDPFQVMDGISAHFMNQAPDPDSLSRQTMPPF